MPSCTCFSYRLAFNMKSVQSKAPFVWFCTSYIRATSQVPSPQSSLLLHPHITAASVCAKHRAKRMRTCPVIAAVGLGLPSVAGFLAPNVGVVRVSVAQATALGRPSSFIIRTGLGQCGVACQERVLAVDPVLPLIESHHPVPLFLGVMWAICDCCFVSWEVFYLRNLLLVVHVDS